MKNPKKAPTEQQAINFDGSYTNRSDFRFPEIQSDYPNNFDEFMSLNNLMGAFQRKPSLDDLFNDPNAFAYSRNFTPVNTQKTFKFDNVDSQDNSDNNPFKSFLETQDLLKETFRKASVASYNENSGYRKNSFDMF